MWRGDVVASCVWCGGEVCVWCGGEVYVCFSAFAACDGDHSSWPNLFVLVLVGLVLLVRGPVHDDQQLLDLPVGMVTCAASNCWR